MAALPEWDDAGQVTYGNFQHAVSGRQGSSKRRVYYVFSGIAGLALIAVVLSSSRSNHPPVLAHSTISISDWIDQGIRIGKTNIRQRYFSLASDSSVQGAQGFTWSYSGETGPSKWGSLHGAWQLCDKGPTQSPVNIVTSEIKAELDLPSLEWQFPSGSEGGGRSRVFYDGHSICLSQLQGVHLNIVGFSRYLDSLPLSAVEHRNFTLVEMRVHTPSEHTVDGKRYDAELQFVHECTPMTDPPCPVNKSLVVSALMSLARANLGEESPSFIADMVTDLKLIQGHWNQYVASFGFDFDNIASALKIYSHSYWFFKGSLTMPPCTEDVSWMVLQDALPISESDLLFLKSVQGDNTRPLQPLNSRAIFSI